MSAALRRVADLRPGDRLTRLSVIREIRKFGQARDGGPMLWFVTREDTSTRLRTTALWNGDAEKVVLPFGDRE